MSAHPDPWRAIDRQPEPARYARMMESRGQTGTQVRLRRRFLRFCRIEPGWRVVEVTHSLLQRRAEIATRFGLVSVGGAARWLAAIERADAAGHFVFTFNYYGARGIKPPG